MNQRPRRPERRALPTAPHPDDVDCSRGTGRTARQRRGRSRVRCSASRKPKSRSQTLQGRSPTRIPIGLRSHVHSYRSATACEASDTVSRSAISSGHSRRNNNQPRCGRPQGSIRCPDGAPGDDVPRRHQRVPRRRVSSAPTPRNPRATSSRTPTSCGPARGDTADGTEPRCVGIRTADREVMLPADLTGARR